NRILAPGMDDAQQRRSHLSWLLPTRECDSLSPQASRIGHRPQFQCPNPPTSSDIFRHPVATKIPVGGIDLALPSQIQLLTNSVADPHRTQEVGGSSPPSSIS